MADPEFRKRQLIMQSVFRHLTDAERDELADLLLNPEPDGAGSVGYDAAQERRNERRRRELGIEGGERG